MRPVRNWMCWLLLPLLLCSCGGGGGGGDGSGTSGGGTAIVDDEVLLPLGETTPVLYSLNLPTESEDYTFDLTLQAGITPKDVYLVVTNPTESSVVAPLVPSLSLSEARALSQAQVEEAVEENLLLRDIPWVNQVNEDPWKYSLRGPEYLSQSRSMSQMAPEIVTLSLDTEGQTGSLTDADNTMVNATCRKVVTAGSKKLNIWVADASWGSGCSKAVCLDQTMVDAMADAFLKPGADNDIYDWTTNVFGTEWGSHSYGNLIPADNNITIFLFDIDNDNSTTGGVAGYFYARDNFNTASYPGSNERLMFAIDSNFYGIKSGATWEVTDSWPSNMLVTLAHELQHMIHFYQRGVLRGATSATWLNEMCSMSAEDLVAGKLGVDGPRGVDSSIGSAGTGPIYGGELSRATYYDYLTLTQWQSGTGENSVLNSYAQAYAFAAFLNRNYGGAQFFRNLLTVSSSVPDSSTVGAITEALSMTGYTGLDFDEVLRRWGIATLFSDIATTDVPAGYRYNQGAFFPTSLNGITYNLGSINMYNYRYGSSTGPRIFNGLSGSGTPGSYPSSNVPVLLGTGLTGEKTTQITLRKGTQISVIVR